MSRSKQTLQGFTELATHSTVDEEVEGVADEDEEVDEERGDAGGHRVHEDRVLEVFDDHDDEEDGQRKLDDEEDPDDSHEHHRSYVTFRQTA